MQLSSYYSFPCTPKVGAGLDGSMLSHQTVFISKARSQPSLLTFMLCRWALDSLEACLHAEWPEELLQTEFGEEYSVATPSIVNRHVEGVFIRVLSRIVMGLESKQLDAWLWSFNSSLSICNKHMESPKYAHKGA